MTNPNAPIFIVGAPRSGTTLTARLLGTHSNIFMPGETHFLNDIYARRRSLGSPETPGGLDAIIARLATLYARLNETPDQTRVDRLIVNNTLPAALAGCRTYQEVYDAFMKVQMDVEGKSRWGNQVPREALEINVLLEMFPDARIIGCVRDVRDFLYSYREKWRQETGPRARRLKQLYHPVITSLIWKKSNSAMALACLRYPNNIMLSRYEDLVAAPEETLRRLCDFVGESFEPAMLETTFSNSSVQGRETGIFKSGISRWPGQLSEADVFIAQTLCRKLMRQHRYVPAPIHPGAISVTGIVLSTPFKLIRALHANRAIRGPLLPYLWKRIRPI